MEFVEITTCIDHKVSFSTWFCIDGIEGLSPYIKRAPHSFLLMGKSSGTLLAIFVCEVLILLD